MSKWIFHWLTSTCSVQQGTLGIWFLTWKSSAKCWAGRATLLVCKQGSRQQSQQARLGTSWLWERTAGTTETEKGSVFLSSASRSLQPGCAELYPVLHQVLHQFRGIWVSRLFSISFWMQEGKNNNNKALLLVWEGGKPGIVLLNTNAFIWAQMEHTAVNVKYHQIRKVRPSRSSRLI